MIGRLAAGVAAFALATGASARVLIDEPLGGADVEGSTPVVWRSSRGDGRCGDPLVEVVDEFGTLVFTSGTLVDPVYTIEGLPMDGSSLDVVAYCTEGRRRNSASVAITSSAPPDTGGGPGTGPGDVDGETVIGVVTLAPDTVVTLAPDAAVTLSAGMTAEELSQVGQGIALVFATAFGVRSVRRALGG